MLLMCHSPTCYIFFLPPGENITDLNYILIALVAFHSFVITSIFRYFIRMRLVFTVFVKRPILNWWNSTFYVIEVHCWVHPCNIVTTGQSASLSVLYLANYCVCCICFHVRKMCSLTGTRTREHLNTDPTELSGHLHIFFFM
jgi:hypothetical protein